MTSQHRCGCFPVSVVVMVTLQAKYAPKFSDVLFLVSCVGERPWWPIKSPNRGRKTQTKGYEEREIRSSLPIFELKDGNL